MTTPREFVCPDCGGDGFHLAFDPSHESRLRDTVGAETAEALDHTGMLAMCSRCGWLADVSAIRSSLC